MVEAVLLTSREAVQEIYEIRHTVFTGEQGMDPEMERDDYDNFAYYVYVKMDGAPAGTGRLVFKDGEYLIGRIAVLPAFRGQQLGDLVVRMLVDFGFRLGADKVHVHSQLHAVAFYEKIGFAASGEPFMENGIEHIDMSIENGGMKRPCDH